MQAVAFRRAQKLLDDHPGAAVAAQFWGALHSLLLLAILLWASLLVSLIVDHGVTHFSSQQIGAEANQAGGVQSPQAAERMPGWIKSLLPLRLQSDVTLTDTGLYPVVARNLNSNNPAHGLAARCALLAMQALPTLRYNDVALTTLLIAGLLLTLLFSLVDQVRHGALAEASSHVATALRRQIHRQIYRLGQSSLPTEGIGPVINLFTREVNDVRDGVYTHIDQVPRSAILGIGLLLVAFCASWVGATFLIALGLLVWVTARKLNKGSRLAAEGASRDAAVQLCLLHEDLGLLRTVRVYGMEAMDSRRFDEHLERFAASDVRRMRTEGSISPTTALLGGAAAVLALGFLGFQILGNQISPAAAVLLVAALVGTWAPAVGLLRRWRAVRQANRSAGAIFEFLGRRPELHQTGGAQFLPPLRERITFEHVSLLSLSGKTLLEGVSFEIPARTRTAIMGLDEDSKLALACLIPRLIDPRHGRVRIDGFDLREVTLESLRAQVATVFQADLVFSDSVVANIGLNDPSYTLPRIIEAAKMAHAHHFIQDLPHGYDTIIGP
ncbi:MAG TPA: ABC transporter ATP-binding protein, partial [Isosphaeraceae bacterium]|nr:ABC transporter ATP-binding protein [Isosphaeraceae bacterium]